MFTYYFPNFKQPEALTQEVIAQAGLGKILGQNPARGWANKGPEGPGAYASSSGKHAKWREGIIWQKIPQGYHLGCLPDELPTPKALLRSDPPEFRGHDVTLRDGHTWHIPVAAWFPQLATMNGDGQWHMVRDPEYQNFYAAADVLWDYYGLLPIIKEEGYELSEDEEDLLSICDLAYQLDLAVSALALNYRVGPYEVSALKLLDSKNVHKVIEAILDGPSLVKMLDAAKKKGDAAASPSTEPGAKEASETTPQLSPT